MMQRKMQQNLGVLKEQKGKLLGALKNLTHEAQNVGEENVILVKLIDEAIAVIKECEK